MPDAKLLDQVRILAQVKHSRAEMVGFVSGFGAKDKAMANNEKMTTGNFSMF